MSNRAFKSLVSLAVLVAVVVSTAFGFCPAKQIYASTSTTFVSGMDLSYKMSALAGSASNIHGFLKADVDSLNKNVDFSDKDHIFSVEGEKYPIYGWYKNGNIYYYTPADNIYLNEDSGWMFSGLVALTNISGLAHVNTSKVTRMDTMFCACESLKNIAPLANWDVSNVNNMYALFLDCNSLEDATCLNSWDVSKVAEGKFDYMFDDTQAQANNKLPNWYK